MSAKKRRSADSTWTKFARSHKQNPALKLNPLYSLPGDLIELLAGKKAGFFEQSKLEYASQSFLSEAEADFERDLTQTTHGGGFFHRRPFPVCSKLTNSINAKRLPTRRFSTFLRKSCKRTQSTQPGSNRTSTTRRDSGSVWR